MTVTRQVERDQRLIERECDGVPRMRVLRPAVEQHDLGRSGSPHERADLLVVSDRDLLAPDRRRTGPRNPKFGRVLLEQRELVVMRCCHGRQSTSPTRGRATALRTLT